MGLGRDERSLTRIVVPGVVLGLRRVVSTVPRDKNGIAVLYVFLGPPHGFCHLTLLMVFGGHILVGYGIHRDQRASNGLNSVTSSAGTLGVILTHFLRGQGRIGELPLHVGLRGGQRRPF